MRNSTLYAAFAVLLLSGNPVLPNDSAYSSGGEMAA